MTVSKADYGIIMKKVKDIEKTPLTKRYKHDTANIKSKREKYQYRRG